MSERRELDEGAGGAASTPGGLERRVERLEAEVDRLRRALEGRLTEESGRPPAPHPTTTHPNRREVIDSPVDPENRSGGKVSAGQSPSVALWDWEALIGGRVLNRVGAVALLCALAFFFKLASSRGWITAEARVSVGVTIGAACLAVGEVSRRRGLPLYAQGLTGCGFAALFVSCYASFGYYHLVSDSAAFAALALITVATMGWAVGIRAETVAALGLSGGFLTPVLLSTSAQMSGEAIGRIFVYLWIISAGAVSASMHRRWNVLLIYSLGLSQLFDAVWLLQNYRASLLVEVFAAGGAFFALYFIASTGLVFAGRADRSVRFIVVENAAAFMGLVLAYLPWRQDGWASLLLSVLFGGCAAAAFRYRAAASDRDGAMAPFLAVGAGLLTLAILLLASGDARMALWCIEAVTLFGPGVFRNYRPLRFAAYPVGALAAFALIYNILIWIAAALVAGSNPASEFLWRVEVPCALFTGLTAIATWISETARDLLSAEEQWVAPIAASALHIVLFVWLTLEVFEAGGGHLDSISPWLSAVWTLYAAVLIGIGVFWRRSMERLWALGVLALVVVKVFLVDIWSLDYFYRIVSLLCLAAALWGASYLYARYRGRIREIVGR